MSNRLPPSSFAAKYPWNQAWVSRSGHIHEIDDTPGKERLRVAHKSGTYWEVSSDGKKVEYVVGHAHQYMKGGLTLTIDHNGDIKASGHMRMLVGGGAHIEVAGDANITSGGNLQAVVMGDMKAAVSGDMDLKSHGTTNINSNGDTNIATAGATNIVSGGDVTMNAPNVVVNANMTINGDITHDGSMDTSGVHHDANGFHKP